MCRCHRLPCDALARDRRNHVRPCCSRLARLGAHCPEATYTAIREQVIRLAANNMSDSKFQIGRTCIRIPAARFRPGCRIDRPRKFEGAGKAGCRPHPQPRMQMKKAYERSHYRFSQSVRLSPRNGFTAYFVISPVERACCHRRLRDTSRRLDASIAAPGPHDLAVRPGDFVRRKNFT